MTATPMLDRELTIMPICEPVAFEEDKLIRLVLLDQNVVRYADDIVLA